MQERIQRIGLMIVGDEILSGRRQDKHLSQIIQILNKRNLVLDWCQVIGDDMDLLVSRFQQSLSGQDLVLSTGGIGATPDDLTRHAVAKALKVDVQPHVEGTALLKTVLGDRLNSYRLRMVEFPEGATLIPNPVNQIPGFSIKHHHFVPGFPQMAWPMIEWVLDQCYPTLAQSRIIEMAVRVTGIAESDLIPLMEKILHQFTDIKVFSLPIIREHEYEIELGVKGMSNDARQAMQTMKAELDILAAQWENVD